MRLFTAVSVLFWTAFIVIAAPHLDAQQPPSSSPDGHDGGFQQRPLVCDKSPNAASGLIDFEVQGAKYFLNVANQSILAQPEGRSQWEFRPCSLSGGNKDAKPTLGWPTATSGHLVLTGSEKPLICLHADYGAQVLDYKPCNYLDDSGQQEFYWLYDEKSHSIRLAGRRNDGTPPIWSLQLGLGKPPGIAVKPIQKGGHKGDEGIVFQFASTGK